MGRPRASRSSQTAAHATQVGQLSLEEIVTTALELTRSVGVDGFTMRDLADRVGVSPASLYHYVPGKRDLKEIIADAVIDRLDLPPDGGEDWDAKLRDLLVRQQRLVSQYPGVGLLYIRERPTTSMLRITNAMLSLLLAAGLPPREALHAFQALSALAFGQQLTDFRHPRSRDDIRARFRNVPLQELNRFPGLQAIAGELGSGDREEYFERALDLLLEGIRVEAAKHTVPGGTRRKPHSAD
jgi:AcrR family transcriptional regulator